MLFKLLLVKVLTFVLFKKNLKRVEYSILKIILVTLLQYQNKQAKCNYIFPTIMKNSNLYVLKIRGALL